MFCVSRPSGYDLHENIWLDVQITNVVIIELFSNITSLPLV